MTLRVYHHNFEYRKVNTHTVYILKRDWEKLPKNKNVFSKGS